MQKDAFFSLKSKRCQKSESYNHDGVPMKDTGCNDHECNAQDYMRGNANWDEDDQISEESDDSSIRSIYNEN
jgi:hypothetical protein